MRPRHCVIVMAYSGSSAPTAHSKSAQGNAIGAGNPQNVALKGRPFFCAFCAALSGLVVNDIGTQGVALGWHRVAPSGRPSTGAKAWFHAHQANLPCAPGHCVVVMVHPGSFAPTAHSKSAQGNALGAGNPQDVALKGRPFFGAFCAALSGLVVNDIGTRALPWAIVVLPLRGAINPRKGVVPCASGKFKYRKSFRDSGTGTGMLPPL